MWDLILWWSLFQGDLYNSLENVNGKKIKKEKKAWSLIPILTAIISAFWFFSYSLWDKSKKIVLFDCDLWPGKAKRK